MEAVPDWLLTLLVRPPRPEHPRPPLRLVGAHTPYGRAALEEEVRKVHEAPKGRRNETLNKAAFALGQLEAGGELAPGAAEDELIEAAVAAQLPRSEAVRTVNSGLKAGHNSPRSAPERDADLPPPAHARGAAQAEDNQPAAKAAAQTDRSFDDIGNAARFVDQHGAVLRYVPVFGSWLCWDGWRWADDDVLAHRRRATDTARALALEAAAEPDDQRRKAVLDHARRSAAEPRVRAMLSLAQADARIVLRPRDLDRDPWVLNTPSGVVDLRTGTVRPHNPADNMTKITGAAYDPTATAPLWEAHLQRCVVDPDVIAFLQRLAGLSAIGIVLEHVLPILWGGGGNGKSVIRNTVAAALGPAEKGGYAHQSSLDLLMQHGHSAGRATPEQADLRGMRFVTVSEPQEDGRLAAERVKAITGGEPITARRLHANPMTFDPSHTIWLSTNYKPRIDDESDAIWRRVYLLEFGVTIPEEERDAAFGAKLLPQLPGVLRWIVDGALAYQEQGLNPPAKVRAWNKEYRAEEDTFGAFLDECTVREAGASAGAAELLKTYTDWANTAGAPALSTNALRDKLGQRGIERVRKNTGTRYFGVRLQPKGTLDA